MSEMSDFFKKLAENGTKVTGVGPGGAQCDIGVGADGNMTQNWSGDLTDLTDQLTGLGEGPKSFLEQAVEKAIYSLNEIVTYAELGRPQGCLNEAKEALELITILMAQHNGDKEVDETISVAVDEDEDE